MKRFTIIIMCAVMLMSLGVSVCAENTAETSEISVTAEAEDKGMSKGIKIAGFLGIFTLSMGVTAYIVMRPKLKMLKEARSSKPTQKQQN